MELLVTSHSSWKCHPSLWTCVPELFWLCLLTDELVPVKSLLLSTNLAPPPLDHFQCLCVSLYSKIICSALASCTVEEGQVWVQTGNKLTLRWCPTLSVALTAQALPALVRLPSQYCFGNWLSFPDSHVCTKYLEGSSLVHKRKKNIYWWLEKTCTDTELYC